MEPFGPLLIVPVVLAVAYLIAAAKGKSRGAAWANAARAVGLTGVEQFETLGIPSKLTGRSGPLEVTLERYQHGKHESGTRISIAGMGHEAAGLSLRREGLATAFEKVVGEREIELGDAAFDAELFVQGSPPLARALLDADTRRLLVTLLRGAVPLASGSVSARVSLTGGVLRADLQRGMFSASGERLPEVLAALLAAARRLVAPADIAQRIADNLAREPEAGVRLHGLLMLLREHGHHPAARAAMLEALADASAEVRLRAALALGEEGRGTLLALATGAETDDAQSAAAVSALAERLPPESAEDVLLRAVRARRTATARACIERLGGGGDPAAVAVLARVLEREQGELAEAAATALGALGHAVAAAPLTAALTAPAIAVRAAAAAALGRVGDVSAVPVLRAAAAAGDADGALKRAVRQSIAEIQARLSGAAPGQLSLAATGAEGGRLSLAEASGTSTGRLSLLDEAAPSPPPPGTPERSA